MIIGIVVAISVIIAFIFTIYFCRCCKWSHDTNDIFKDVDKDIVVNYKEAVPVKPTANGKDIKDKVRLYCSDESYFCNLKYTILCTTGIIKGTIYEKASES